jgi:iron complex transport system ATP-binding protein
MINIQNLSFAYHRHTAVLKDVTFSLKPGQLISVLGPNGCGKTTLLKAMLGFLPIKGESIFINGPALENFSKPSLDKLLEYVPQYNGSVFAFSVREMVLMGRTCGRRWGSFSGEDILKAQKALDLVQIASLADRSFLELSGGQKQLVIIARALAQNSPYIFMDEPTAGLDLSNQIVVLKTMKMLHEDMGLSFLMTTHNPEQAVYLGGEVLMMKEGRVTAWGAARELTTPGSVEELYGLKPGLLAEMGLVPACLGQVS